MRNQFKNGPSTVPQEKQIPLESSKESSSVVQKSQQKGSVYEIPKGKESRRVIM